MADHRCVYKPLIATFSLPNSLPPTFNSCLLSLPTSRVSLSSNLLLLQLYTLHLTIMTEEAAAAKRAKVSLEAEVPEANATTMTELCRGENNHARRHRRFIDLLRACG